MFVAGAEFGFQAEVYGFQNGFRKRFSRELAEAAQGLFGLGIANVEGHVDSIHGKYIYLHILEGTALSLRCVGSLSRKLAVSLRRACRLFPSSKWAGGAGFASDG